MSNFVFFAKARHGEIFDFLDKANIDVSSLFKQFILFFWIPSILSKQLHRYTIKHNKLYIFKAYGLISFEKCKNP